MEPTWTIIKNERGITMKRLICFVVLLCLVCSAAAADIVDDFNVMAGIFSCRMLLSANKTEIGEFSVFTSGDCKVTFKGDERIFVEGKGEDFAPYCMAAIMTFETDTSEFKENAGRFYSYYLLARDGTEYGGTTTSGLAFIFQQTENGLVFTVGK